MRLTPLFPALAALLIPVSHAATDAPNIIIYMVDDLGWNHVQAGKGTMGTTPKRYQTPEIARLAADGLSFTHAYSQPNCAPTRAAMLSGQYPARIHNKVYVVGSLNRGGKNGKFKGPEQGEDVDAEAITVAEALKENGYATAHIGKYHVGGHEGGEATLPEKAGFDINIGGGKQGHQGSCFASKPKNGNKWGFKNVGYGAFDKYAAPYTDEYLKKHGFPAELKGTPKHVSDAVGDALEETVATLAKGDKPFYIQFHTYAVHGPVKARPDLFKKAEARVPTGHKAAGRMAHYLGFIDSLDLNLARMRKMLEDPNGDGDTSDSITKNTLILFTSDNGGTHADNLPLKGNKGMLTEGGIRVPLIACWPGTIPAGTVTDNKVHSVDYYPTYLELAGNKWTPPADTHPLDGTSFADLLKKPTLEDDRDAIFFLFPGYLDTRATPSVVAIDDIAGKRYKLYYYYEGNRWELYCLSDDQEEAKNLIKEEAEKAKTLSVKMLNWLNQEHPTWKPSFPLIRETGKSAGPPPGL
ncbi:sulfatase [Haloferula rosea]|uniref:Sulfatase n=1 Tax=Haloferula rosea TaxID=490093 RepID=A0A934VGP4_9BACT|nr:sulfatase [Haloferula rosea]MBK1828271.1 sulfatase [Haloferula rosea]